MAIVNVGLRRERIGPMSGPWTVRPSLSHVNSEVVSEYGTAVEPRMILLLQAGWAAWNN